MRKIKIKPKAVIFDMDGVIVDSMPYHLLAWHEALRPLGIRVSPFDVYQREGERWDKSLKDFLQEAKIKPTPALLKRIFARRKRIFRKYFKRFIFPGTEEFLRCLKRQGYLLGLATGTPIAEIKRILPKKLQDLFDCLVAGDMVKNGKPHPEPYLKAAKYLNLEPGECVVVENAPLGIESAKRAGMFCVAITTSLPHQYLNDADIVVNALEEITGIIERSCRI